MLRLEGIGRRIAVSSLQASRSIKRLEGGQGASRLVCDAETETETEADQRHFGTWPQQLAPPRSRYEQVVVQVQHRCRAQQGVGPEAVVQAVPALAPHAYRHAGPRRQAPAQVRRAGAGVIPDYRDLQEKRGKATGVGGGSSWARRAWWRARQQPGAGAERQGAKHAWQGEEAVAACPDLGQRGAA